jgi:hypothetical protein
MPTHDWLNLTRDQEFAQRIVAQFHSNHELVVPTGGSYGSVGGHVARRWVKPLSRFHRRLMEAEMRAHKFSMEEGSVTRTEHSAQYGLA